MASDDVTALRGEVKDLKDALTKAQEELREARDLAHEAYRAKREFMANMNHELKTPLNGILGYSQLLLNHGRLDDNQYQQVDVIRSSGEHLLALINGILAVADSVGGKVKMEIQPFAIAHLFRRVMGTTRSAIKEKRLSFKYQAMGEIPKYLLGDVELLGLVLSNLLGNAVKYTHSGGIILRAGYLPDAGGTLRCEVIDTGIGIPAEKLDEIFEPFTQLATTERLVSEGAGVGLTIARLLITHMRGRIGVESEIPRGSVFWLEVPLPRTDVEGVFDAMMEELHDMHALVGELGDVVAPPRTELEKLLSLADRGDMRGIQMWAAEQKGEKCRPFADHLGKLAVSFKTKAVLALVKESLAKGEYRPYGVGSCDMNC